MKLRDDAHVVARALVDGNDCLNSDLEILP